MSIMNSKMSKFETIIEYKMKEAMEQNKEAKANLERAKEQKNEDDIKFWELASARDMARFGAYYDTLEVIKLYK